MEPKAGSSMGRAARGWILGAARFTCAALLLCLGSRLPGGDRIRHVVGTPGNEVRVVNTYPEHWVDGRPFFMHAAAFFYQRTPRDRWAAELQRLKDLGVNTIDLYPFWNWHQPEEDVLDFDGHTNPRRDLKYLLHLLDRLGFKVTCRPGPFFCNEWRNGGYPDWLLRRPEYKMSQQSVLEGRYPLYSALEYQQSEMAAEGWLENATHLKYTAEWYRQILGLAEPYLAGNGGNILHIQIDDDQGCDPANYNGPRFWEYMDVLRQAARKATHHSDIPYYINGSEMRENAEANDALPEPFWNMGQDYQMFGPGGFSSIQEGAKNKINTDTLKTEPLFPPCIIEFGAGFRLSERDSFETPAHEPSNTLMASRVMLQNGLKGLNYFSLNDTLYPAGYEAPWANYFYPREGAIDYLGREQGRAPYARRNGRLIGGMGHLLGATHALADAALAYSMGTFPQAEMTGDEAYAIYDSAKRILWSGAYAHYNFELVDPDHNPLENLERYSLLLLFDPAAMEKETGVKATHLRWFSEKAQRQIQKYLQSGGTVLIFPSLPGGDLFQEIFRPLGTPRRIEGDGIVRFVDGNGGLLPGNRTVLSSELSPGVDVFARDAEGGVLGARYSYAKGRVVFFGGDFSRWSVPPEIESENIVAKRADLSTEAQLQARAVIPALMRSIIGSPRAYPDLNVPVARDPGLYVTQLVSDSGSGICDVSGTGNGAYGFVGVTNFTPNTEYAAPLVVTNPRSANPGASPGDDRIQLPLISLPPRESLMLPLRIPLNSALTDTGALLEASSEVFYATVELSRVGYDGRTLALEFTAPMDGEVALRLAQKPLAAKLDGQAVPVEAGGAGDLYVFRIPRGAAPDFIRRLVLDYSRSVASVRLAARTPLLIGRKNELTARIDNPGPAPLHLKLEVKAGMLEPASRTEAIDAGPGTSREIAIPVAIPADTPDGMVADIRATVTEAGKVVASDTLHIVVQNVLSVNIDGMPGARFPLREDLRVPIVHPVLASLDLPESARFQVRVSNRGERPETVRIEATGAGLLLSPASFDLVVPARADSIMEIGATPRKGTGAYRFAITVKGEGLDIREDIIIAAVAKGESVAYAIDFDRDGFTDLVMENRELRCFITPHAGGRSFALVRKKTDANAFTSVGGLRDNFSKRLMPADLQGIEDGLAKQWLGLYNRPYSFRILEAAGTKAVILLAYDAPDIYPKGVRIERTMILPGSESLLLEAEKITVNGVEEPQAFVRECSVPFRKFMEEPYNQWLVAGDPIKDFVAESKTDLPPDRAFFATVNRNTGETFAVITFTKPQSWQLNTEVHSALLRIQFPDFTEAGRSCEYRIGYYFGDRLPSLTKLSQWVQNQFLQFQ
jgi:hypothetical protein